ncbi:MAG: hypothetical protein OXN83_01065 [Oligoflexia bacterium]|nr:hypothetical protein [Oligoflexia bacterium]
MITDKDIQNLIEAPKEIHKKEPKENYKVESNNKRCKLILSSVQMEDVTFEVFTRQNQTFIENFSIGLRCKIPVLPYTITLIRYNGPHDSEKSIKKDNVKTGENHHPMPHIHRVTQAEVQTENLKPPLKQIEITDKYNTFEDGFRTFLIDMNISNWNEYFPELEQGSLFNGH